jgi:release factor glutamine methyltransferase
VKIGGMESSAEPGSAGSIPPAGVVAALRGAGCVFAEQEAQLLLAAADGPAELARLVRARVAGTPLEYLVGWVEFDGLRIAVTDGVFVPRQRSRLLVRAAVGHLAGRPEPLVVELCCGCGAIGLAIAAAVPGVRLHAADIDPVAVGCARSNLAPIGAAVYAGDLFAALPGRLRGAVDVLVANAPYVPTAAIALMPPEARDHEPGIALDGGPDGTRVLRRVIAGAVAWLAPDGVLLVEVGTSQIPLITTAFTAAGLAPQIVRDEELGATVALGRPAAAGAGRA